VSGAEIRLPEDLWDVDEIPEGVLNRWMVEDGEAVDEGAVVAVVTAEKTEYEIASPTSGALKIRVQADEVVTPGTVIGEVA